MKDQMRAEFEAWIRKDFSAYSLTRKDGAYLGVVEDMWIAWQAALSAVPAQEPTEPKFSQVLIDTFQELNMGNYGDDDVRHLNNWAIDAYRELQQVDKLKECLFQMQNANIDLAKKLSAQPAQEPVGEVQHYAAPANLPAYVNMKWYGKPPKNGTKLYTAPVKQESKPESAFELLQQSKDNFERNFGGNSLDADWIYSDLQELFSAYPTTAPNWINADKRLPDHENDVFVYAIALFEQIATIKTTRLNPAKTGFYVAYDRSGLEPLEKVTHWMPLPLPPVEVKE